MSKRKLPASSDSTAFLRGVGGDAITLVASEESKAIPRMSTTVIYTGGLMTPELNLPNKYRGPVVADIAGMYYEGSVPMHRDHDTGKPVGHTTSVSDDGRQLSAEGLMSIASDDRDAIVSGLRSGFPWRPSVGLKLYEYEIVPEGKTVHVNGRDFDGPFLLVTLSELKEIGIVSVPGDAEVDPIQLAAKAGSKNMKFNAWLKAQGIAHKTIKPLSLNVLKAHYDSLQAGDGEGKAKEGDAEAMDDEDEDSESADAEDDDEDTAEAEDSDDESAEASDDEASAEDDDEAPKASAKAKASGSKQVDLKAQMRKAAASEERRVNKIRTLCRKFDNPSITVGKTKTQLSAHAIAEGWSLEKTELMARRQQDVDRERSRRPRGPGIHSTSRRQRGNLAALQAGIMLRAGIQLDNQAFSRPDIRPRLPEWMRHDVNNPVRDQAMNGGQEFRYMSTYEVLQAACDLSGVSYNRGDKMGTLQAALSTGNVSALFGATIGAKVLESYAEIQDNTIGWTSNAENPDLEQHVRIRMESLGSLEHNPTGQPAAHATRSTKNEYTAVNRFAKQITFDEADLIGDNFQKLKDTPRDMGLAAGRVIPDLVFAVLLSNPALSATGNNLFSVGHGNDTTGAALARATLSAAIARLAKRKDGDANLNLSPSHLLVPPELFDLAVQLLMSLVISNDSGAGEKNVLNAYGIQPVSEARLSNGVVHPLTKASLTGSNSRWTLVSNQAHTIEVTTLEGAGRVPLVRTNELMYGQFGLNCDCRLYAGATALDFRGFDRNAS